MGHALSFERRSPLDFVPPVDNGVYLFVAVPADTHQGQRARPLAPEVIGDVRRSVGLKAF